METDETMIGARTVKPFAVLAAALFLSSSAVAAGRAKEPKPPDLKFVRVKEIRAPKSWTEGMQWIQADKKGRVYLLRSDVLEVYPVEPGGALGEPLSLGDSGLETPEPWRVAAMGEKPEEWLLLGSRMLLLDGDQAEVLERPNQPVWSITLFDGRPVALLGPAKLHRRRGETFDELPLLATWDGREWRDLVVESVAGLENPWGSDARAARDGELAPGRDRTLWLAQIYAPRLRQIHASGKTRIELVAGGEKLRQDDAAIERSRKLVEAMELPAADAARRVKKTSIEIMTYKVIHYAITVADDGRPYVLAAGDGEEPGLRLRRWDPVRYVLEEVGLMIDVPGMASMAWGRDGLHVAQWNATMGRYFIPRERLENARWRPVEEVEIEGVVVPPPEAPEVAETASADPGS
ncbi:MAG: hypothetical protein D6696_08770 [Acidobacteria bacterium]|nr:MAG: hypothetical protein D6696_08770 [Acidobacteriota bacterium]